MRKNQGVELVLKPINMHGGGYSNFLQVIKSGLRPTALLRIATVLLRKTDRWDAPFASLGKKIKKWQNDIKNIKEISVKIKFAYISLKTTKILKISIYF